MKRPGKLIALMLFLVSCGTQEKDLYVVRGQIHNLAMKESPEKAHALFLKFADDCHAKGDYDMEACGLYEMATNYLDQRDTLGLRRILDRMERLSGEHPESLGAGYSYYSVLGTYYAALYEQDGLDTTRETLFAALRRAIDYQEQMSQEDYRRQSIVTAWNYYNVAVSPNTVITERSEVYAFFVAFYSDHGNYEKALEYEMLKARNDGVRFGVQRNAAVREVEAKYNVAQVKARLAKVRGWAVSLGILSLLFIALTLYYRLLIRSKEEGRYTAAVEALVETDADIRVLTEKVSAEAVSKIYASAQKPLSAVERKYILLFMSGKSTEEIAETMHVAPASVYTMKYRIKKKYPDSFPLPF